MKREHKTPKLNRMKAPVSVLGSMSGPTDVEGSAKQGQLKPQFTFEVFDYHCGIIAFILVTGLGIPRSLDECNEPVISSVVIALSVLVAVLAPFCIPFLPESVSSILKTRSSAFSHSGTGLVVTRLLLMLPWTPCSMGHAVFSVLGLLAWFFSLTYGLGFMHAFRRWEHFAFYIIAVIGLDYFARMTSPDNGGTALLNRTDGWAIGWNFFLCFVLYGGPAFTVDFIKYFRRERVIFHQAQVQGVGHKIFGFMGSGGKVDEDEVDEDFGAGAEPSMFGLPMALSLMSLLRLFDTSPATSPSVVLDTFSGSSTWTLVSLSLAAFVVALARMPLAYRMLSATPQEKQLSSVQRALIGVLFSASLIGASLWVSDDLNLGSVALWQIVSSLGLVLVVFSHQPHPPVESQHGKREEPEFPVARAVVPISFGVSWILAYFVSFEVFANTVAVVVGGIFISQARPAPPDAVDNLRRGLLRHPVWTMFIFMIWAGVLALTW